jgi:hypothetical protein
LEADGAVVFYCWGNPVVVRAGGGALNHTVLAGPAPTPSYFHGRSLSLAQPRTRKKPSTQDPRRGPETVFGPALSSVPAAPGIAIPSVSVGLRMAILSVLVAPGNAISSVFAAPRWAILSVFLAPRITISSLAPRVAISSFAAEPGMAIPSVGSNTVHGTCRGFCLLAVFGVRGCAREQERL